MLSLWKRNPIPAAEPEQQDAHPAKRNQQLNIKVSDDCSALFATLAKTLGISKAALFEDLVAERLETLQRRVVR